MARPSLTASIATGVGDLASNLLVRDMLRRIATYEPARFIEQLAIEWSVSCQHAQNLEGPGMHSVATWLGTRVYQ